jgi:FtsH-binding integral membrane protein
MKDTNKYFTSSIIARLITTVLLFVALSNQQIGYYKFLRWITFATAIYIAFISYIKKEQVNFGVWLFGLVALLFNPIIPFYLSKNTWQKADVIVGVIFILSIFFIREKKWQNRSVIKLFSC